MYVAGNVWGVDGLVVPQELICVVLCCQLMCRELRWLVWGGGGALLVYSGVRAFKPAMHPYDGWSRFPDKSKGEATEKQGLPSDS